MLISEWKFSCGGIHYFTLLISCFLLYFVLPWYKLTLSSDDDCGSISGNNWSRRQRIGPLFHCEYLILRYEIEADLDDVWTEHNWSLCYVISTCGLEQQALFLH